MSNPTRRHTKWLIRVGVALVGLVIGVTIWATLLPMPGTRPEDRVEQVVTRLPRGLAEIGRELLGQTGPEDAMQLEATGIIEARRVDVASEFAGRVASMRVTKGQHVVTGDLLAELDTTLLEAQISAAEAGVSVAEAALAQAQAGVRPGQIAIAEAELEEAQVAQDTARQILSDTLALMENPQELRLQIAVMEMQAQAAGHRVAQATALKDAAELVKNEFEDARSQLHEGEQRILIASGSLDQLAELIPPELWEQLPVDPEGDFAYGDWELHVADGSFELYRIIKVSIPFQFHLAPNQWWQAWVGVNAAEAEQEGLQNSLYQLRNQLKNPQTLEARVDEAVSTLAQAESQVLLAQAQLEGLQAGPSPEQIGALQARVDQAKAAVEALEAQREMHRLKAPLEGTVIEIPIKQGEVAAAGTTLITIANLNQLTLVVYVPENRVGQVAVGMAASVSVDSFPGREFEGIVSGIADQAQYTPRNVATQEERVNLVFAVQIRLSDSDGLLKPGLPATARFTGNTG